MSRRKSSAVTVRSLETGEVIRVEDPARDARERKQARESKRAERRQARRQRAQAHAELNQGWHDALKKDN